LVLNNPNQTLAIADKLRTDNVQLTVQSKTMMNTIHAMKSNTVSVLNRIYQFCLLQMSVSITGDDAMSDACQMCNNFSLSNGERARQIDRQ